MAWRPNEFLMEGELDNTVSGKVTGWMKFAGIIQKVSFDLNGDFNDDIKGKKILIKCTPECDQYGLFSDSAHEYMKDFCIKQVGDVGDITCEGHPYIEWYSENNGRVVLESKATEVKIV